MNVVAVVLTYNSEKVIGECLTSLTQEHRGRVLVIDNASTDNSVKLVKTRFPKVTIDPMSQNLGYAGGNNVGIEKALAMGADYILILNPDVVVEKDCLKYLLMHVEAYVSPQIVGPKIFKGSSHFRSNIKLLWSVGGVLDEERYTAKLIGLGEKDKGQYDKSQPVDFVSGTCMLIPKTVLETGLRFYVPYFMYYEDVEFCIRARKLGFTSVVVPEAKITHFETSNNSNLSGAKLIHLPGELRWELRWHVKDYYLARNHLLFVERNAPIRVKLRELIRLPKTIFEHVNEHDAQSLQGVRDYITRKFGQNGDFKQKSR